MAENTVQQHPEPPADKSGGSTSRGFCIGCIVASVGLTVLFALVLSMLFSSRQEVVARGKSLLEGEDTVEQVDETIMTARERMLRGMKPSVSLTLTDADLNEYIQEHPDEIEIPSGLEDPKVAFGDGFVEVSVRTKILFIPTRVRAELVPEVEEGTLVLRVEKVSAGDISAPGVIRKSIASGATDAINKALQANRMDIKSVKVTEGLLTVEAVLKPKQQDPAETGR